MKKIVLALSFVLTAVVGLQAQNATKAKGLLDEVYNKVNSYSNVYIDFKYVLDNSKEHIHQETKGNVTMSGDKYMFNYLGATKLFDGKKVYTIVPDNEEVTVEGKSAEDEGTITPSKMLTFYKDGYNYAWDIKQTIQGRAIQYVKLTPIKSSSDVKELLLGIDVQTKHIYNLIEVGKNGTKTTITVTNMKVNQKLPASTFTFDRKKYENEGYYIAE